MATLHDTLRKVYSSGEKAKIEATLCAAKDALESYSGRSADIEAVVGVLLDALESQSDPEVVELTLEALNGATFHPNFPAVDLGRLVKFLERANSDCLAVGLEILAYTSDTRHKAFISSFIGHADPKIAANAVDALREIESRQHRLSELQGLEREHIVLYIEIWRPSVERELRQVFGTTPVVGPALPFVSPPMDKATIETALEQLPDWFEASVQPSENELPRLEAEEVLNLVRQDPEWARLLDVIRVGSPHRVQAREFSRCWLVLVWAVSQGIPPGVGFVVDKHSRKVLPRRFADVLTFFQSEADQ